ncbi:3-oxoacyl-ACP reductase [Defluviimonas sp. 20V17]|uniref:3-oxoacyl-ACP reductase n=1 Tax=Allgaiera indica TaxID=765699 RepID=A0AAN4ZYE3_9RHOB|nr:SDR family oxidoreductase [Allgaiera indica]KDB04299.1 3-oxoacyl-ACP reductase [Defluviimonas sp. 20V17]GHD99571.1 3-oxoacyl-ACP reductase [Allgaiera indica]SDW22765.1 NADP-dependent 3-hydroxy acid dehydrogenase YdfG [Allgaiera indica]
MARAADSAAAGTVIVTGASAGIGRAVALLFLREGWNVALLARRLDRLQEIADGEARALAQQCDVTDPDAVDAAFAAAAARFGRIDVLFNNAGLFPPQGSIDMVSNEDWARAVAVNLTGMFYCARAAFGAMRAQRPQGGRIINNGSISAHVPRPGSVAYTTTKHAITGLTKSLSLDGRPYDIACGQIDIGNARTELLQEVIDRARAEDPEAPVPPTMDVAHVAEAVLNMARLPPEANVQFMTLMATKMPYIGRG